MEGIKAWRYQQKAFPDLVILGHNLRRRWQCGWKCLGP